MKRSSLTICLLLAVSTTMCVSVLGEKDDPFAGGPKTPPVYDAAYYAKRAKEDLEGWRAYLKHIGEPDLKSLRGNPGTEIYRFIFRPHFSKDLILTAKKTKKILSFEIRRFSEKLTPEIKGYVKIDSDIFGGIRDAFAKPQVFDPLGRLSPEQREALSSVDGSWWHLETLRDGKYTHAVVWSPEEFSSWSKENRDNFRKEFGFDVPDLKPFEGACLELVQLSGLPLDAKNYEPRHEQGR